MPHVDNLVQLVLWTDARTIVNHFGLRGLVYLNWNKGFYQVNFHKNYEKGTHESKHPLTAPLQQEDNLEKPKEETDLGQGMQKVILERQTSEPKRSRAPSSWGEITDEE